MKDKKNGIEGKEYDRLDPQVQLRMLTENIPHQLKPGWYPFDDADRPVAAGIRERAARGPQRLGAQQVFSDDDAYRCLDTAERLLTAIGAPAAADEVKAIRLDLRRLTADKDDRKVLQVGGGHARVGGAAAVARGPAPARRRRDRQLPGRRVRRRPLQGRRDRGRRQGLRRPGRSSSRAPTSPRACAT